MKLTFAILLVFLGLGLVVRKYNGWTRLLLIVSIAAMIAYLYRA
jgi:1,4-dihydroxy-2-naphthoate octaprenyltransferase